MVEIYGIQLEVSNTVSCLSNEDYNKKYGTKLKDVPKTREIFYSANPEDQEKVAEYRKLIKEIVKIICMKFIKKNMY